MGRSEVMTIVAVALLASACVLHDGPLQIVNQSAIVTSPVAWTSPRCKPGDFGEPPASLCAGAAEVDITPPPGLPTYGYSTNGVAQAKGYWLRLKARVLVFEKTEETAPDRATRVVLIQADLGAASALVQRKLASALATDGIGPANLMFATTHTHGGPGGFFGDKFYNHSVGAIPAFVPEYVDALVASMREGVERAFHDLRPARIGVAEADVADEASHNRSYDAWAKNFVTNGIRLPDSSVDHTLRLLRVDTIDDQRRFTPRALWSVFAVHGNTMAPTYPLYHGDVHGLAARLTKHWIEDRSGGKVHGFVAAMATGAEGDVGPGKIDDVHGKDLTMKVAGDEALAAVRAFHSLDHAMDNGGSKSIDYAYEEISLRGAGTKLGHLCEVGVLGASEAAGSEESRGPLYGFLGMVEGSTRDPYGCEATKVKIGGGLQDLFYQPTEYPDLVPFQVIAFGDRKDPKGLFLASFPGEPTTEVGRLVRKKIAEDYPGTIAVVGLTNSYATYFTTPAEYLAQDYEGGATLYGPYQGLFAAEQLQRVGQWIGADDETRPSTRAFPAMRSFQAGEAKAIYPTKKSCDLTLWRALDVVDSVVVSPDKKSRASVVTFRWKGMTDSEMCGLPTLDIECGEQSAATEIHPFVDDRGYRADDEGFDFEVWRDGESTWNATWAEHGKSPSKCRFVARHDGMAPITSNWFDLKP